MNFSNSLSTSVFGQDAFLLSLSLNNPFQQNHHTSVRINDSAIPYSEPNHMDNMAHSLNYYHPDLVSSQ